MTKQRAGWRRSRLRSREGLDVIDAGSGRSLDRLAKSGRQQLIAQLREIRIPAGGDATGRADAALGVHHQLEITDMLGGGADRDLGEHVVGPGRRGRAELPEGREEMVVAVQRRIPVPHRHRVDSLVEERAVTDDVGRQRPSGGGIARRRHNRLRRRRDAQAIGRGPLQVALRVDRAGR